MTSSLRTALALSLAACLMGPPLATSLRAETTVQAMDPAMTARLAKLSVTMQIGPVIDVMQEEGVAYGATLAEDMFPGGGDSRWGQVVAGIYDAQRMKDVFNARFAQELAGDPAAVAAIEDFFGSERGQRILRWRTRPRWRRRTWHRTWTRVWP
jgi:hypothetical protein